MAYLAGHGWNWCRHFYVAKGGANGTLANGGRATLPVTVVTTLTAPTDRPERAGAAGPVDYASVANCCHAWKPAALKRAGRNVGSGGGGAQEARTASLAATRQVLRFWPRRS